MAANISDSLKSLASPRYMVLTAVGIGMLLVFGFLSLKLSAPVLTTLYSNLSAEDSASVVTELGGLGVKFEVKSGGAEVMVESAEVLKVRMILAQKGLPGKASIVGYEIFDKESMLGSSNFVMNVNYVRALEGELARTMTSLSTIKSARVHLVIPRKDLIKRNNFEPSASVVLTLNNRLEIPKEEAQAVRHIVASSVPGLSPSKITIVDSNGKMLAKAKSEDEAGGMQSSADAADYKFQLEERLRNNVTTLLEQIVGAGKVETQVSADISFERTSESSEKYDPDGQVARSTQTSENTASSSSGGGGEVSAATELTGGAGGAGGGGSENNNKTDEITNFEISKTVTNKVNPGGTVKKITAAVLIDGKYTKDAAGADVYTPRTDEELDQIRALVRSAVGFDETRGDKIDVVNLQFNQNNLLNQLPQEGPLDWLKRDLQGIIKTFILGVVAILTIMLVIKPLVNKAFSISTSDIEAQEIKMMANNDAIAQAAASVGGGGGGGMMMGDEGGGLNLDVIQSKIDYSPAQKVNDLIDSNPDATLSIIRTWMTENRA